MIKLFASDLDGTLLNEEHTTDETIIEMINSVIEQKKHFVIATGRPIQEVYGLEGFNDLKMHVVCLNGAQCYDENHNLMFENLIDKQFVKDLVDTFPNYTFEFCDGIHSYAMCDANALIDNYFNNSGLKDRPEESKNQIREWFMERFIFNTPKETILKLNILKINVPWEKDELKLMKFLQNYSNVNNQPSASRLYEITSSVSTKGSGVEHLAQILNINIDEIATFGDGDNDASMLMDINESYAPKNSSIKAIEAATYHLDDEDEHAVSNKIKEILKRDS